MGGPAMYVIKDEAAKSMPAGVFVLAAAEGSARVEAMKDRMRYVRFFEYIEKFAQENKAIVGGDAATRALLGETEPDIDSFFVELYTDRARDLARRLATGLYGIEPDGLGHYTTLLTRVPDEEFLITVDGRDVVKVHQLAVHRGARMIDVILPARRPMMNWKRQPRAKEGSEQLYMGPEVQLMGVYATLCSPAQASEWKDGLELEAKLRKIMIDEIKPKLSTALSLSAREVAREPQGDSWFARRRRLYDAILRIGSDRVVVGDAAIRLLDGDNRRTDSDKIHFVTASSLESERATIVRLAGEQKLSIESNIDDPRIPTDPRLRKMTIYIGGHPSGRKDPILYMFTSAAYELVPYTISGGIKVGTPFVLMRFRLVEMWTIQRLFKMQKVTQQFAQGMLFGFVKDIEAIGAALDGMIDAPAGKFDAELIFPRTQYVGRLENSELARKRAAYTASKKQKAFFPPYYPARAAARAMIKQGSKAVTSSVKTTTLSPVSLKPAKLIAEMAAA